MSSASEVVLVHGGEEPPEQWSASLFLAGPTPRTANSTSWRPAALEAIRAQWDRPGRLVVFVPEPRDGQPWPPYEKQRTWELYGVSGQPSPTFSPERAAPTGATVDYWAMGVALFFMGIRMSLTMTPTFTGALQTLRRAPSRTRARRSTSPSRSGVDRHHRVVVGHTRRRAVRGRPRTAAQAQAGAGGR